MEVSISLPTEPELKARKESPSRPGPPSPRLIACIPAYNEEIGIGSVVLKAKEHVDEVIVINDCSTDDTAKVARCAGARVITHHENRGYGGAIKTAFEAARAMGVDAMVILDGDGQHDPDEIPKLVQPIEDGTACVVVGNRFDPTTKNDMPGYRKIGIKLITRMANLGMSTHVTDSQSGYRAFCRKAIENLQITDRGIAATTEMLLECSNKGLKVREVPITVRYDVGRSSEKPLAHAFGLIGQLVRYAENKHPLLVFSLPGVILFTAGFLLGLHVLYTYSPGTTAFLGLALTSMVLIFVGVLSAYTGLLLHAIVGKDLVAEGTTATMVQWKVSG